MRNSENVGVAVTWLALGLLAVAGIRSWDPPAPAGPDAPAADFSAARAMAHVRAVAGRPHPLGSPANARVRDYIVGRLRELGLSPGVQEGIGLRTHGRASYTAGLVENIAARVPGTGGGRAVMLVCHYDSVANAPGASDDGHAVAAILETLRALRQSMPLRHDVIALFTDGEEAGLLGAEAFVSSHPWAREAAVALNFEARGTGGPAIMFETSPRNGPLIRELAQVKHPAATSLSYEVYRRMPNDTDFSVFRRAGIAGMNFAYLDRALFYHTPADDARHLDMRSLQQQGEYALGLVRRFASGGLEQADLEGPEAIYFNIPGGILVRYPQSWAVPLALVVCAGLAWILWRCGSEGVLAGILVFPAAVAAAGVAGAASWWLARQVHSSRLLYGSESHLAGRYQIGFVLLALAVTAAVYGFAARRWRGSGLPAGAEIWWGVLALAISIWIPGLSYLFLWPLAFTVLGRLQRTTAVANALGAVAVLLWAPVVWLLWVGMGLGMSWLACALLALVAGLLTSQTIRLAACCAGRIPAAVGAAAIFALFGWAAIGPAYGPDSPRTDSLMYIANADAGTARWATWDRAPDEWTQRVLTAEPERSPVVPAGMRVLPLPNHAAPFSMLEPLKLEPVREETAAGRRTLTLRATSPRVGTFALLASDGPAELVSIGERRIQPPAGSKPAPLYLRLSGLGAREVPLVVSVAAGSALRLATLDAAYGLPDDVAKLAGSRPPSIMAGPQPLNGAAVAIRQYVF
jgi:hypothetical protein